MHVHLPKPLHGWREFAGEVGIVVIGVLLALGAEQAIEALHHRAQVRGMAEDLHAQSVENRRPLDADIFGLQQSQKIIDANVAKLGDCSDVDRAEPLAPVQRGTFLVPLDNAWIGARDSALLPLLPKRLADSYFKLDTIKDLMLPVLSDVQRSRSDAGARVEAVRLGLRDRDSCRDAVVQLLRLRMAEALLLNQTEGYRVFNEQALHGEVVDALVRPGPLNVPKIDPGQ